MRRLSTAVPFLSILFACFFALWPLMKPGFYVSDDGEWMVIRLSAFYQALADGQFPVRFLGRLNNSFGYPVANFLYPGFLYIGSVLHLFGFSFVASVKFILIASVVGTSIWIYASLRRTFSAFSASLGTLSFIGSPYLLYDLYSRGSVGEILAFLPGSVGIYSIIANKPWLFPLAVSGLIVSHNTLAVLFSLVFLVFLFIQRRRDFLWPFIMGIGIAAFFWIPAIAEKRYVRFDTVAVSNPMEYVLGINSIWMAGVAGAGAGILLLLGRMKKVDRITRTALMLYIASLALALPQSAMFWAMRPVAALVQFPYRMLAVGTLVAPWLVAAASERFVRQKVLVGCILLLILVVPAWYHIRKISFVSRELGYYTTNEGTTTVADEYMPRWVTIKRESRAPERIVFEKGRGSVVYEYLNTQRVVATVDASEESILRLNTIYYPGWGIMMNGKLVPAVYQNPYGLMEFEVPVGSHRIEAEFRETIPRFLADVVSVGSVVAWAVFLLKGIKRQ